MDSLIYKAVIQNKVIPIRVTIKRETIEKITALSSEAYPKEFLMFFEGKFKPNKITINDIIFQPYIADERSALPRIDFPLTSSVIGSVHSHPSPRNKPSRADMRFFRKTGLVHAIICKPYTEQDIAFYDIHGEEIQVEIID